MASFKRRVKLFLQRYKYRNISRLTEDLIHDESIFYQFTKSVSVTSSEMFRDPMVFRYIREYVIPYLSSFPHIRIWHAACAKGEEVYSLAIMLKEEGIYDRCTIYATDMNQEALERVQQGIFPLKKMQDYSRNYQLSGGKNTLSDYYHAKYDDVIFNKDLIKNVTFSNHNLTMDGVFMETQFILCRNVMIYFNQELQNRVLNLFNDSLIMGGVLCLGNKETIKYSTIEDKFSVISMDNKIYRKDVDE